MNIGGRSRYLFLRILTAHTNSHATSSIERALSNKMNNNRADDHCYSFAWIYRSRFFFWRIINSTDFLRLAKKWRNCRLEVWIFCKIPFFLLTLRLSVRRFQMRLEELSFVKSLATFGICNAAPYSMIGLAEPALILHHFRQSPFFGHRHLNKFKKTRARCQTASWADTHKQLVNPGKLGQ